LYRLDIAPLKEQPRIPDVRQVLALSGPQIVDHDQAHDVVPLQEPIDQMRSHKAGAAGDKHGFHDQPF
jgi:hypothetical protein